MEIGNWILQSIQIGTLLLYSVYNMRYLTDMRKFTRGHDMIFIFNKNERKKTGKTELLSDILWDHFGNQTKYMEQVYGKSFNKIINRKKKGKCVKRERYKNELLRFYNIDPRKFDKSKKIILIFGTKTTIGHFLKMKYINNYNYNLITFRGYYDFDFANENLYLLFNEAAIEKLYICYQPIFRTYIFNESFSQNILKEFYTNINNFVIKFNTECTLFIEPPFIKNAYNMFVDNNKITLVFHPYIIDESYVTINNIVDQELSRNKIHQSEKCEIPSFYDFYISFVPINELITYILDTIKKHKENKRFYYVECDKQKRISEYFNNLCNFKPDDSNHKLFKEMSLKFGERVLFKNPLPEMKLNYFLENLDVIKNKSKMPYITFIVTGRNDNYSGNFKIRIQNMFNSIANGMEKFPGSNVEVMFVSYRNPIDQKHIPYELKIPEILKKKMKITIITDKEHEKFVSILGNYRKLNFFEFIGKNVASRRVETKFILFTNGDNIFPEFIFEIFSLRQFNPTFFYKTERLPNSLLPVDNMHQYTKASYPWLFNISKDSFYNIYNFSHKKMHIHLVEPSLITFGFGDFNLLSKDLFDMLNGYDQHPSNWGIDHLLDGQMFRFATNHISFKLNIPIFHQEHSTDHSKTQTWFHYVIINEIKCRGYCIRQRFPFYNSKESFGFKDMNIKTQLINAKLR